MTAPIDYLMDAKAARDQVRGELMKAIRKTPKPWGPEIEALLRADDAATEGLSIALKAIEPIPEISVFAPHESPPAGDLTAHLRAVDPEGRFS